MNLASRLETAANPGEILISYETYALVKGEIDCRKRDQITVKGMPYPITTYEVFGIHEDAGQESTAISSSSPNMTLNLDLDAMSSEERMRAAQILRDALDQVST